MKHKILISSVLFLLFSLRLFSQSLMRIWDNTPVSKPSVTLTPYLPSLSNANGTVIIICPGGSYFWHDKYAEGECVARWLSELGFAAYVLKYRTAGWLAFAYHTRVFGGGVTFPSALQDLQRSILMVRSRYSRVGVMGFSAGGHLALAAAAFHGTVFIPENVEITDKMVGPDFIAAIYPVVTFSQPCVHKRSRRGLLGEYKKRNSVMCDSLSMERHAATINIPVFLMNCKDDPVVNRRNAELMDSALTANCKDHIFIQYEEGGHGFGADPKRLKTETMGWKDVFLQWYNELTK